MIDQLNTFSGDSHPELNGVYVGAKIKNKKYNVATDSFRLMAVETDTNQTGLINQSLIKQAKKVKCTPAITEDVNYPEIDALFTDKKTTITLNIAYLYDLANFLKKNCKGKNVKISVSGETDSVEFTSETKDGQNVRALIMPIHP